MSMLQGGGRFALWVVLCCAVPLAALSVVLLFDAPLLATALVAFVILGLIAPRLLAVASPGKTGRQQGQVIKEP